MKHIFLLLTVISLSMGAFGGALLWRKLQEHEDPILLGYARRFAAFALSIVTAGTAMYAWSFSSSQQMVNFFVVLFLGSLIVFNWFSLAWLASSENAESRLKRFVVPFRLVNLALIPTLLLLFLEIEWLNISIIVVLISLFSFIQTLLAIEFHHLTQTGPWWSQPKLWFPLAIGIVFVELWLSQDGDGLEPFLSIALPVFFLMETARIFPLTESTHFAASPTTATIDQQANAYGLSQREIEISKLVLQGLSNKQIAYELSLSENTVRNHLSKVFQKTGARKRTELFTKLQPL